VPTSQQKPTKAAEVRREHQDIASRILAAMSARDREVLMRFYRHGQAAERIQADLGVTETEFRRIKSRAKASFTAHVQQRIEPQTVTRNRTAKRG
jgi:DNA-directed RNA polymerase specialized sigma24 family protein